MMRLHASRVLGELRVEIARNNAPGVKCGEKPPKGSNGKNKGQKERKTGGYTRSQHHPPVLLKSHGRTFLLRPRLNGMNSLVFA